MQQQQLIRQWFHSHEEDTPSEMTFRPAGYALPPSRGRIGFELRADGTLVESGPGPDDRSASAQGTWELQGNTLVLHGATDRAFKILSVADDRLVVARSS